jgi:hypothetical protein
MFIQCAKVLHYKYFTIVICDFNDRGLYYKTTILANLALTRSLNYDHKVHCKHKRTLTIVNYNCKTFTVPAIGVCWCVILRVPQTFPERNKPERNNTERKYPKSDHKSA